MEDCTHHKFEYMEDMIDKYLTEPNELSNQTLRYSLLLLSIQIQRLRNEMDELLNKEKQREEKKNSCCPIL